jgi:hypothetical protein
MIAVAVAGVVLGLVAHLQALVRDEEEFAVPILIMQAFGASVLLAFALAIRFLVNVVRRDDTYAARLRRDDLPDRCPFPYDPTAEKRSDSGPRSVVAG